MGCDSEGCPSSPLLSGGELTWPPRVKIKREATLMKVSAEPKSPDKVWLRALLMLIVRMKM